MNNEQFHDRLERFESETGVTLDETQREKLRSKIADSTAKRIPFQHFKKFAETVLHGDSRVNNGRLPGPVKQSYSRRIPKRDYKSIAAKMDAYLSELLSESGN